MTLAFLDSTISRTKDNVSDLAAMKTKKMGG